MTGLANYVGSFVTIPQVFFQSNQSRRSNRLPPHDGANIVDGVDSQVFQRSERVEHLGRQRREIVVTKNIFFLSGCQGNDTYAEKGWSVIDEYVSPTFESTR